MKTKTISFTHAGVLSLNDTSANIFVIFLGSLLISILAQISILLPFSPVPITGQTIGVVLIGGILGSKRGALSVLSYLGQGALGFPVFAQMKSGAHVLIGPTAGYLWGFVIAAFIIGLLAEKGLTLKPISSFLSCFIATTIILILGTIYLAVFKMTFNEAMAMGFYPFLVGDVIKSYICAILLLSIRKIN